MLKGYHSLLVCHTRCKCAMGNTCNLVKVTLGIKVMKFGEIMLRLKSVTLPDLAVYFVFLSLSVQLPTLYTYPVNKYLCMLCGEVPSGHLVLHLVSRVHESQPFFSTACAILIVQQIAQFLNNCLI